MSRPASPENLDYPDKGCDLWDRCLTCPLPRCRYDNPRRANAARDAEIARLHREGMTADELARRFRLSRRSVFRAIQRAKNAC